MNVNDSKFTRKVSDFISNKVRCRGDLYLPSDSKNPPVVIMAHGFGAERTFGLPAYAEHFAHNGFAVYLFDYRCFGDSDGEPRNYVSAKRHLQDWEAAIAHVRSLPNIQTEKIALWGSSFSGGHVIVTAARDGAVSAIIAQVPHVDAITTIRMLGIRYFLEASYHGLRDLFRIITFRSPYYVKIISNPEEFACLNTPECFPGYSALIPEDSNWQNRCPARITLTFGWYRPLTSAGKVACPALIMAAEKDTLIDPKSVELTASKMPNSTVVKYPFGHFDLYRGDAFNDAVKKQTAFLKEHLDKQ